MASASGMSFSDVFLSLALFHDLVTIVVVAYSVLTLYDLESDYVNARSAAEKLNHCVPILAYLNFAIAVLVLASGRVLAALLVAGVLARIVHRIVASPAGNLGLVFDPTEIRARPALRRNLKEFLAYGAVHVASFFLIMNSLVHDLTALAEL